MGTQYSVDEPEERTPEDDISDLMGDLMGCYEHMADLATDLGVSVSTVYRVCNTGKASRKTLAAMHELHASMDWE